MNSPLVMLLAVVVVNHLWQSTLFAAAIGVLALLLRGNSARVRHVLWLIASLKFLVPFALLAALATQIPWHPALGSQGTLTPRLLTVAGDFAAPVSGSMTYPQPFARPLGAAAAHGSAANITGLLLTAGFLVWALGVIFVAGRWLVRWLEIRRALRKAEAMTGIDFPAPVRATAQQFEPGVVGIMRPMLLLPAGIEQRLTPAQMRAVLAHERCHLRWRDNLTAALHMLVETVFWFYPPVWWIGARLIDERERACDEQVGRDGHAPQSYVEGILAVCEHYIASRLPCVSGVSGSDLRKRIESILKNALVVKLDRPKKLVLAAMTCCAVAAPLAAGMLSGNAAQVLLSSAYSAAILDYWSVGEAADEQFSAAMTVGNLAASTCPAPGAEIIARQKALAATVANLSAADGDKVLLFAVAANSTADVRRLLAAGAARNGDSFMQENSLMHIAARFGDVDMLEVLVNAGFSVGGWAGPFGHAGNSSMASTPLMLAISSGHRDNVRWLIQHGADVNATNEAGKSALIPAMITCRDQNLVTQLIRAGAQPTPKVQKIAKNIGFDLR